MYTALGLQLCQGTPIQWRQLTCMYDTIIVSPHPPALGLPPACTANGSTFMGKVISIIYCSIIYSKHWFFSVVKWPSFVVEICPKICYYYAI